MIRKKPHSLKAVNTYPNSKVLPGTVAGGPGISIAAAGARQQLVPEASPAERDSGQCSQHVSNMADSLSNLPANVCNSHCAAHTELSHIDTAQLASKMAASHSSCHSNCHSHMQQVLPSPHQAGSCPSQLRQDTDMQVSKVPTFAHAANLTSATSLPKSYRQAALDEHPAADNARQLADARQSFFLSRPASADDSSLSLSFSDQLCQHRQGSDGANSCPPHADLGNSHSTADAQATPVSTKSSAEKQVIASQQAFCPTEAAMSSTPAVTMSSKVTSPTCPQTEYMSVSSRNVNVWTTHCLIALDAMYDVSRA